MKILMVSKMETKKELTELPLIFIWLMMMEIQLEHRSLISKLPMEECICLPD